MGLASWELFSAPLAKGQALAVSLSFAFLTLGEEFFEAWALRAYGSSCKNTILVRVLAVSEHLQPTEGGSAATTASHFWKQDSTMV